MRVNLGSATTMGIATALALLVLLSLACSRPSPEEKWAREQVRLSIATFLVEGGNAPREGKDYSFAGFDVSDSGTTVKMHVVLRTPMREVKPGGAASYAPGDMLFTFRKDADGHVVRTCMYLGGSR